jgi:hypothetical protein
LTLAHWLAGIDERFSLGHDVDERTTVTFYFRVFFLLAANTMKFSKSLG